MSAMTPDLLNQLRNAQYDELDAYLNSLQDGFEQQIVGEQELLDAFQSFDVGDVNLGERFSDWLQTKPESYAAHVALATWLHRRGRDLRGGTTANLVSDQGMRGLLHFTGQAEAASRHATTLTANPLAAWMTVEAARSAKGCEVSQADVDAQHYPDWYAEPLRQNPHSLTLRQGMLAHLRTEWGGSEQQMISFVRQQQDAGLLSQTDMQKLWAQYHAYVAHHEWLFKKNVAKAVEHAQLSSNLNEKHAELLYAVLTHENYPIPQRRETLERFIAALERHPENGLWYARTAFGQDAAFLAPYAQRLSLILSKMARTGNADAAWTLGLIKFKTPASSFPDPRPFLTAARERGSVECADMLLALQEKDKSLSTIQKQREIIAAADVGSSIASWVIYKHYDAYQSVVGLDNRARFKYLSQAADAGNNDARFALAQQLRGGFVEMGEDGVLRPVNTPPIQHSLDYAKHLLERAASEGHLQAQQALRRAKANDWDAATAKRLKVRAARTTPAWWARSFGEQQPLRVPWFLLAFLAFWGIRACSHLTNPPPTTFPTNISVEDLQKRIDQSSPAQPKAH